MSKREDFVKRGVCKNIHGSSMSNLAWCNLNKDCSILKVHDKCPNPKFICQKVITFTRHRYMFESGSIKSKLKSIFRGTIKAWDSFIKQCLKMATPLISTAVAAKTKNPQSVQITNNILKSLTGGKILSPTDMHGRGLRLRVM